MTDLTLTRAFEHTSVAGGIFVSFRTVSDRITFDRRVSDPVAQQAFSLSFFAYTSICFAVLVAMRTLGYQFAFSSMHRDGYFHAGASTFKVDRVRYWLEVMRINAAPMRTLYSKIADIRLVTGVVKNKPFGNRSDVMFIGPAMSKSNAVPIEERSISSDRCSSVPDPALAYWVDGDFLRKAIDWCSNRFWHCDSPMIVVTWPTERSCASVGLSHSNAEVSA